MGLDAPFNEIPLALSRKAIESMPRVDLCADLVLPLLLGVVVAAYTTR
jgi:hypothetical protein